MSSVGAMECPSTNPITTWPRQRETSEGLAGLAQRSLNDRMPR